MRSNRTSDQAEATGPGSKPSGRRAGAWVDQGDGTSLRCDAPPSRSAILDGYTADVLAPPPAGDCYDAHQNEAEEEAGWQEVRLAGDSDAVVPHSHERELRLLRDLPKNDREADPYAWSRMVRNAQAESRTTRPGAAAEATAEADGPETELEAAL
jgi:hypothetical protein